jgi:tetratricopeptide (TPR) repeat protein
MQIPQEELIPNSSHKGKGKHNRQKIELLLITISVIIITITMITIVIWIVINQGFSSNSIAIVSLIVAIVLGLPSLMFAYFQWRHPVQTGSKSADQQYLSSQPPIANLEAPIPQASNDASHTAEATSRHSSDILPSVWNVPYQRNPIFTGREDELLNLSEALRQNKKVALKQPLAISGLGGIGKTQIAIEYTYRYHKIYQAVIWIKVDTFETFISDITTIAALLNLPESKIEDQKLLFQAVNRWLQNHTDWLLILDNVEDWLMIREFIPLTTNGHIILTTRGHTTGVVAQLLEIKKMTVEEGALLLLRRAHILNPEAQLSDAAASDLNVAKEISQIMGGIPLALDQAGAYIEENKCTLSDYLTLYQARRLEILNFRGETAFDHPESVVTTWLLSFQKVEQKNIGSADLLCFCAFLYPDIIPEEIILDGSQVLGSRLEPIAKDPLQLNNAIKELLKYSLLQRNTTTKTLSIHRLVQAVIKDYLDQDIQRLWIERVVQVLNIVFPDKPFELWERSQLYIPHIETCVTLIEEWKIVSVEAARLLDRAGCYLEKRGQYTQAELFLIKALNIREKILGQEHPDVATSFNNLGLLYYSLGKYDLVEPLYQRALSIREKILGQEHPDSILNLALLYYNQGKYELAEPLYKQALVIYERTLGPEHPQVATVLNDLAWLYHNWGNYSEAKSLYPRALSIRKYALGEEHPDVAQTLNAQAMLYRALGQYVEAEELFKKALTIREKMLGENHPENATTLNDLAWLYNSLGKYTDAEPLYQRALEIRRKAFSTDHPFVATILNDMAILYINRGSYFLAESLLGQALAIREKTFGEENPRTASTIYSSASLQHILGRYTHSENLHLLALNVRKKVLGLEHPHVAQSLNGLASLYVELGKYVEAEPLFQQALAIRKKILGPEHRHVATTLNDMGSLYVELKKFVEAELLYQQALAIRKMVFGPKHPDVASSLNDLASLYFRQGEYVQAEKLYHEARTMREKALGTEHPHFASTLYGIAEVNRIQGKYPEAEILYKRVWEIYERSLSPEHPRIAIVLESYAVVLRDLNQGVRALQLEATAESIRVNNINDKH